MDNKICPKCGNTKFEVYAGKDLTLYRCINCEKTLDEVLKANGFRVKENWEIKE